ncbi:hypothetical protein SCHPADRAFT_539115 [Schizopora paradoxa]|uniref:Uncharacterized protein n=1 Tax=Schizopora paradoxa TaxID=27342 RepID=A0A0H2REP3_9AGAM|nr:hypothetical protein SCHPADRAFT_539115 [Schizopora paradoxa]
MTASIGAQRSDLTRKRIKTPYPGPAPTDSRLRLPKAGNAPRCGSMIRVGRKSNLGCAGVYHLGVDIDSRARDSPTDGSVLNESRASLSLFAFDFLLRRFLLFEHLSRTSLGDLLLLFLFPFFNFLDRPQNTLVRHRQEEHVQFLVARWKEV